MIAAPADLDEDRVRQLVGEALAVALPVALKLIDNHIDHRFAGGSPLFHGWGSR